MKRIKVDKDSWIIAAGTAAALAVTTGVTPGNLDVKALQRRLLKQGVLLESVSV